YSESMQEPINQPLRVGSRPNGQEIHLVTQDTVLDLKENQFVYISRFFDAHLSHSHLEYMHLHPHRSQRLFSQLQSFLAYVPPLLVTFENINQILPNR